MNPAVQVVWFKRDLRVQDHAPLTQAARLGPVLCLYVIEPDLWRQPDMAAQHHGFLIECLQDLRGQLAALGVQLQVAVGTVPDVLARVHAHHPIAGLHSHQETGNTFTYDRDKAVARWCRAHGVPWQEHPQFGVVRALRDRSGWQRQWQAHMAAPCVPLPLQGLRGVTPPWQDTTPSASELGLPPWSPPQRQRGGRHRGAVLLRRFIDQRSGQYRAGLSSPLSAPSACSRLSAHLAYGTLSLREVVQATWQQQQALPTGDPRRAGLSAFVSRLHWHCHFIQKLESEPAIEWRNLHRGYDSLRESEWNPAHFEALVAGRTGWPMVDACVAMLRETGWLNFRMRAMLVSVAAYPLWLHWRDVGLWLARQFLDYEPGIHWSQLQMQSGTTGINATRVYNPIKQAMDHDPQGHFVRRWLPAMRRVPDTWLWQPWLMPADVQARCGVRVGEDIPMPLVDLDNALREAKRRIHQRRAEPDVRAAQADIVQRHGSRSARTTAERTVPRQARLNPSKPPPGLGEQLSLGF